MGSEFTQLIHGGSVVMQDGVDLDLSESDWPWRAGRATSDIRGSRTGQDESDPAEWVIDGRGKKLTCVGHVPGVNLVHLSGAGALGSSIMLLCWLGDRVQYPETSRWRQLASGRSLTRPG